MSGNEAPAALRASGSITVANHKAATPPMTRGSVVALSPSGGGKGDNPRSAPCGIIWKVEGADVLWIPVVNSRGDGAALHRADILVTSMSDHVVAGFSVPRPVVECRKLLRRPASMFAGKTVLGVIPEALMARIADAQVREARTLAAEIRLGAIGSGRELAQEAA